jgi:glycosyltransferase involved in cell wall biosynthesis
MDDLPEKLKVINLNRKRIVYSIFRLARILWKNKYNALIYFQSHTNVGAVFASLLSFRTCKLVLTKHSSVKFNLLSRKDIWTKLALIFMKYTFHYADMVIAVSEEMGKEMQEIFRSGNVRHIFIPIDREKVEFVSGSELIPGLFNGDKPVIIGIGRLTAAKNFDLLIRSLK